MYANEKKEGQFKAGRAGPHHRCHKIFVMTLLYSVTLAPVSKWSNYVIQQQFLKLNVYSAYFI